MEGVMLTWKGSGNIYMNFLKEQCTGLTTEKKLEGFEWKLAMPIAQSAVDNTKLGDIMPNSRGATAELTFEVTGDSAVVRLNKTQLQCLYEELEKIQIKVDELTK